MDYYNYDIIIVGGGIAGLYMAYKLKDRYRILLLEKNGYIGGRIHTNTLTYKGNTFRYECGAGRIPTNHIRVMNLIKELKLDKKLIQLGNDKTFISVTENDVNIDLENYIKDFMNKSLEKSETYLRNNTLYDFLLEIYPENIVENIIDKFGYKGEFWVYSAYDALRAFKNDMNPDNVYMGMIGGLDQIIDNMIKELGNNVTILTKHFYNGYTEMSGKYIVNIVNKKTKEVIDFVSDKLVLALPKNQIEIQPQLQSKRIRDMIHSVEPVSFCRIYAVYNKDINTGKVWFDDLSKVTTDSKIGYIIPINKKIGLVMISYTDDIYADFWFNTYKNGDIGRQLYNHLKEMFPDRNIPMRPAITRVHYWGSGGHFFTPGNNSDKVITDIIKPFKTKELYIVGETYSSHQSWIEGALETCDLALAKL
jgi:monoamine oxidase